MPTLTPAVLTQLARAVGQRVEVWDAATGVHRVYGQPREALCFDLFTGVLTFSCCYNPNSRQVVHLHVVVADTVPTYAALVRKTTTTTALSTLQAQVDAYHQANA